MNQSQRSGTEKKKRVKKRALSVSDMKLSARVTAGRASSHPSPCPANANGGSPHLNLSLSLMCHQPPNETVDGEEKSETDGI